MEEAPRGEALLERVGEGSDPAGWPAALQELGRDLTTLIAALRRPLPPAFLELVAATRPWADDRRVAGVLVQNPRTPVHLAQRLVSSLYWRDLAGTALNPYVAPTVRLRAEGLLAEQLGELRLGDRIALARLATPAILRLLLAEGDARVLPGALFNPRLQEPQLLAALRAESAPRALLEAVAASPRWRAHYAVRLELALNPRTPLPVALALLTGLVEADLRRVLRAPALPALLRAAAKRALEPRNLRR